MNVIHALSLTALLASSVATQANILIVDETHCTLIDAIVAANTDTAVGGCPTGSGADIIELTANVTLKKVDNELDDPNGLPSIIGRLTLNGHNHSIVRSTAGGTPDFRLFHITEGINFTLNEVYLRFGESHVYGGAIFNEGGNVTINRSILAENDAWDSGGAIFNSGVMKITNSTLANNTSVMGGGVSGYSQSKQTPQLTIINSTISANQASYGGGFFMDGAGDVALTNVTMTNNTSERTYGGFYGRNISLKLQTTIMANSYNFNNFGGPNPDEVDCIVSDPATDLGGNLIEHDGNCGASSFASGTDPKLAALAMEGGPTPTHAPRSGSPVINVMGCGIATDQRGVSRPKPPGGKCDVGSVEFQGMDTLLMKFDAKIAKGTLKGTGNTEPVRKAHKRDYRNLLLTARNSKIQEKRPQLCAKLKEAEQRLDTDGKIKPNEWVTGKPAPGYAARIQRIQQSSGCR